MTIVQESSKVRGKSDLSRAPLTRLAALLDGASLRPLHEPDDSGVQAVLGTVDGIPVAAYCSDADLMGGALGSVGCSRIVEAIERALMDGIPVLGIWHSGGARLAEGVESLHGMGEMFAAMVRASGIVPQISVVVGPAAGGAAYGPALTDIVVMAPEGKIFVTGPDVVKTVTGEQIDKDGLGGLDAHFGKSGVVHVAADDESDAYERARYLTQLLVGRNERRGLREPDVDLSSLLPARANRAYDVHPIVEGILDREENGSPVWQELQSRWAPNVVIGLGALGGRSVGVIANNPIRKGGCLDSLSAEKAARFVRLCDAFGIPLVVLVDVPGYLPGIDQEWGGVVRRGAKLLHAFAESVVPRVTVVLRKSYGGAYIAMNSRALGAIRVLAWPDAEVAVMGARAAVGILHRKKLAAVTGVERAELEARLVESHEKEAGGLERAITQGYVDAVIDPADTRSAVLHAIQTAERRRGSHTNIPL